MFWSHVNCKDLHVKNICTVKFTQSTSRDKYLYDVLCLHFGCVLYFRCQIIIPQSSRNQAEFGGNSAGGRLVVFYISTEPGL